MSEQERVDMSATIHALTPRQTETLGALREKMDANADNLRAKLAEANAHRDRLVAKARSARNSLDHAKHLLRDAGEHAQRLKDELNAAQDAQTKAHARDIAAALRIRRALLARRPQWASGGPGPAAETK